MEKHIKDTGKCNSSYATKEDKKAVVDAQADLDAQKEKTAAELVVLNGAAKIVVDDLTVADDTKPRSKEVSPPVAFPDAWPTLKVKFNKWKASLAAFDKFVATFEKTDERTKITNYHADYNNWFKEDAKLTAAST